MKANGEFTVHVNVEVHTQYTHTRTHRHNTHCRICRTKEKWRKKKESVVQVYRAIDHWQIMRTQAHTINMRAVYSIYIVSCKCQACTCSIRMKHIEIRYIYIFVLKKNHNWNCAGNGSIYLATNTQLNCLAAVARMHLTLFILFAQRRVTQTTTKY